MAEPYFKYEGTEKKLSFTLLTPQEARMWVDDVYENFSWLGQTSINDGPRFWSSLEGEFSRFKESYELYLTRGDEADLLGVHERMRAALNNIIKTLPLTLKNNPDKQFVLDLKAKRGNDVAFCAAMFVCDRFEFIPGRSLVEGVLEAMLYGNQVSPSNFSAEKKVIDGMIGEFSTELETIKEKGGYFGKYFFDLKQSVESEQGELADEFHDSELKRENEFRAFFEGAQGQLNHIVKVYDGHMALASPVRYWEDKRKKHAWWALGVGMVTVALMFLAGLFLKHEVGQIEKKIHDRSSVVAVVGAKKMHRMGRQARPR
ncbi:hypothetical protein [Chromobacterium haemolyticum]|uniref:hypothetical protein n=1 Tax=Chromobacterium haemolyticum TaxID=394935 RepID=UPI0013B409E8|nr:hypothetical protein [Chromobacterium haemolyticum]